MTDLENECESKRGEIRYIGAVVKGLINHPDFRSNQVFEGQHSEMKANLMLSFRHLEDARMRLGKVMQQIQGGVSKFDKEVK